MFSRWTCHRRNQATPRGIQRDVGRHSSGSAVLPKLRASKLHQHDLNKSRTARPSASADTRHVERNLSQLARGSLRVHPNGRCDLRVETLCSTFITYSQSLAKGPRSVPSSSQSFSSRLFERSPGLLQSIMMLVIFGTRFGSRTLKSKQ